MGAIGDLIDAVQACVEQRLRNDGDNHPLLRASGVSTYSGP